MCSEDAEIKNVTLTDLLKRSPIDLSWTAKKSTFLGLCPTPIQDLVLKKNYVFKRQVAIYSRGSSVLDWRIVAGGNLPTGRTGLRVVKVSDVLYALGGRERANNNRDLTTILSWDPVGERWNPAGYLSIGRSAFAAVALPSGLIQC